MKSVIIALLLIGLLVGMMVWMGISTDKRTEAVRQTIDAQTTDIPALPEEYSSVVKPVIINGMDCLILYRVSGVTKTLLVPSGITCDWDDR